jgi:hypothetical protein
VTTTPVSCAAAVVRVKSCVTGAGAQRHGLPAGVKPMRRALMVTVCPTARAGTVKV